MKNKHIGSNFDDFLREEELLEEVEAAAIKRIIAYELQLEMEKNSISITEMAQKMKTSRSSVRRLLDPKNTSVTFLTLFRVASALGKKLEITWS